MKATLLARVFLVLLVTHGGAIAQGWVDVTPAQPGPPGATGSSAMCYDPIRMVSWLFRGGSLSCWSWDGIAWVSGSTHPTASTYGVHAAVWDPVAGRVILAVQPLASSSTFDFYTWDGTTWGSIPSLGAAGDASMSRIVYDTARSQLLFLNTNSQLSAQQMYAWNGTAWNLLSPVLMPPLGASPATVRKSLFYDCVAARPVLVVDLATQLSTSNPVYFEWTGANWVQRYPQPCYSNLGQVATASARSMNFAQTFWSNWSAPRAFAVSNGTYSELFLTNWPSIRTDPHVVYDSHRDRFVLHGGSTPVGILSDTWELALGPTASFVTIGSGCAGSGGTPTLAPQGGTLPRANTQFTLQVAGLPWTGPVFMFLGFSNTQYGAIPLPANLAILGAPLCNLYVSGDSLFGMTNVLGLSTWTLPIPNVPGFTFYSQAIAFDPPANPLGLTLSNAGRSIVGQ